MEVPAEALLVGVRGHPHDHGVPVGALGEEPQRCRLPAQLVEGVVQVGEVLDLGDRQQAGGARAEGQAEYGLLVQEGVEHPGGAEALQQPARHAVHPALAGHVLPEEHDLGAGAHDVGQRAVDRLRQGERTLAFGRGVAEQRGTVARLAHGLRRDLGGAAGGERRHDLVSRPQPWPARGLQRQLEHMLADRLVAPEQLVGHRQPGVHQELRRGEQGIALKVCGDLTRSAVRRLDVGARVAHQADHAQVQERR